MQECLICTRNTATCARKYCIYMVDYNPVDNVETEFRVFPQINIYIIFRLLN